MRAARPYKTRSAAALLLAALAVVWLQLASCGPTTPMPTPTPTPHSQVRVACTQTDSQVADPDAPHGLFVNAANSPTMARYAQGIQQYLQHDPTVCGANLIVPWSSIDRGPAATPRYDWSFVDEAAQPWVQANKRVNLIVWGVAERTTQQFGGQPATPAYVLRQVHTVTCGTGELPVTPVYWEAGYQQSYQAFARALDEHYASTPWVGYIRFGIGTGGEDYPENNLNKDANCLGQWESYGYSSQLWEQYSLQFVDFEKSLNSPKPLLVGLNAINGEIGVPDTVAARAIQDGFGIGIQGLSAEAKKQRQSDQPCYADWCSLFEHAAGKVPLEVQTTQHTDPSGQGSEGSLTVVLPFALQEHAQIFELYPQEWLIADDPSFPGYSQYHTSYAQMLAVAANVVGGSSGT